MIGIYKITNKINNKCYIGQSKNISKRWKNHKNSAYNPNEKSYNYPLYRAFRKYGLENFSFEILEECSIKDLNQKEKYYINKFNSFFNGYNLTLGGDGAGNEVYKEKIIGVIKDLETTDMFHREIANKWDISIEMVQGINTGRYWRQDREYPIQTVSLKRRGTKREQKYCIDCGTPINRQSTRCVKCSQIHSRISQRPTREELKQLIRILPFTKIGEMFGVSDNAIRRWCDAEKLPRKSADIKKYTDEEWEKI